MQRSCFEGKTLYKSIRNSYSRQLLFNIKKICCDHESAPEGFSNCSKLRIYSILYEVSRQSHPYDNSQLKILVVDSMSMVSTYDLASLNGPSNFELYRGDNGISTCYDLIITIKISSQHQTSTDYILDLSEKSMISLRLIIKNYKTLQIAIDSSIT